MTWRSFAVQDIGGRHEQQDRCTVLHSGSADTHLAIVADGVGGHGDGSLAAQTVIDEATRQFSTANLADPEQFLEQLCMDAHQAILDLNTSATGMSGSTCVFLLVKGSEAYWAHVGDSRLYLVRGDNAVLRTTDHSVVQLRADTGVTDDGSEVGANQLYMCLGGGNPVVPETDASVAAAYDVFLLCSDGFWGQLDVDEVAAELARSNFERALAEQWVQQAKQAGASSGDNISLVLLRLDEEPRWGMGPLLRSLRRLFARDTRLD